MLDIKLKQEDAKKAEIVRLTEQVASLKTQVLLERDKLETELEKLGEANPGERMVLQRLFLKYTYVIEEKIAGLKERIAEVEKRKKARIAEIMEIRKFRKGLQRLREKAYEQYMAEQQKEQQNLIDDRTTVTYARNIMSTVN